MWAFADHAMDQSEDPRIIPGVQLDWNYHWRRDVFFMAEFIAKHDGSELRRLTRRLQHSLMESVKLQWLIRFFCCPRGHRSRIYSIQ